MNQSTHKKTFDRVRPKESVRSKCYRFLHGIDLVCIKKYLVDLVDKNLGLHGGESDGKRVVSAGGLLNRDESLIIYANSEAVASGILECCGHDVKIEAKYSKGKLISERAFRFLMEKSNQWKCDPQEAEARIIEEAAKYAESRREGRLQKPVCYSGVSDGSSAAKSNAS